MSDCSLHCLKQDSQQDSGESIGDVDKMIHVDKQMSITVSF